MVLIHSTPFEAKWDGREIVILYCGDYNTMSVKKVNGDVVFTLYDNGTSIYDFVSPIDDIENIYISFLIDDTNEVAKPSMIYFDGTDTYTYNVEEPTDEEMADIYLWLLDGIETESDVE